MIVENVENQSRNGSSENAGGDLAQIYKESFHSKSIPQSNAEIQCQPESTEVNTQSNQMFHYENFSCLE